MFKDDSKRFYKGGLQLTMKENEIRPKDLFQKYLDLAQKDIKRFFNDKSGFAQVSCPACSSSNESLAMEKLGFKYMTCGDCGSLFLSPRPTPEIMEEYYQHSESVKFWGTCFFKETADVRREKLFKPRAEFLRKVIKNLNIRDLELFVDVGSGYGIFLEEVERLSIFENVLGIEPAPNLAQICRGKGFEVIEGMVEDVDDLKVSGVSAFEVIEHVYDPLSFLKAVKQIMKPDAFFIFTTLTVSGFDIQVLWGNSKSVYPPHHINLLSVNGMSKLIKRSGLEIIELTTPGELDVDIVRNFVRNNNKFELPRFLESVVNCENDSLRDNFQSFLQKNLLSSHIRIIAQNKNGG